MIHVLYLEYIYESKEFRQSLQFIQTKSILAALAKPAIVHLNGRLQFMYILEFLQSKELFK